MLDALDWMEGELEGRGGRTFFADGEVGMLDYCVYPWFDSLAAVERMGIIEVPWEERFPKLVLHNILIFFKKKSCPVLKMPTSEEKWSGGRMSPARK